MLQLSFGSGVLEAGCDEAGRGCLAGPVFAAAVILPDHFSNEILNDSKLLTVTEREELRPLIESQAIAWAVAMVGHKEIDRINILWASVKAMHLAVGKLSIRPELLLIDGNRFKPYKKIRHQCIVQGDSIYAPIAAASVLAKTYRDDYVRQLHLKHPHYGWNENKGYATKFHRQQIEIKGMSPYHRRSFRMQVQKEEIPVPELFDE